MAAILRASQPRHRWFHTAGNAGLVKFLKRSGGGRRSRSCSLEDIFQIVIMIFVESANSHSLLGAFQLTANEAVLPAGIRFERQSAVGP